MTAQLQANKAAIEAIKSQYEQKKKEEMNELQTTHAREKGANFEKSTVNLMKMFYWLSTLFHEYCYSLAKFSLTYTNVKQVCDSLSWPDKNK